MFYYLSGELAHRENNMCVIDCSGVGYKLTISAITSDSIITKLGKQIKLYTHLAVREDGIELFGFGSTEERECFSKLISVSGIGPKVAMSILSTHTPEKLAFAIASDDVASIAKTPGIGKKTALRIILELKDKLSAEVTSDLESTKLVSKNVTNKNPNISEAIEGLMFLGYDKNTILAAMSGINPTMNVADIIQTVLKKMAR